MTFKKFLSVFVLTFFVKFGFGQVYQAMPQYGYGPVKRFDIDSTLTIPTVCGVPTLKSNILRKSAIAFDTCNNKFYTYNSKTLTWSEVSGGGGSTDTTSLSNRINLKLNISDTANKWVNSVTKLNDSTIRVIKGTTTSDLVINPQATRLITQVFNKSGTTISKGAVIYIDGKHSNNLPSIALAQANNEANSYKTFALVSDDIPNMSSGYIVQAGTITGLNLPTSTYTDGDVLYLSPTVAGGYTTTKPLAPYHICKLGSVVNAHPTQGRIEIKIENGWQLDELSDVSITLVPADSVLLQFSRVDSLWHDVSPTTAIGSRYIKPSDTSAMLSKYLRKTDTASLSDRINLKMNYSDTVSLSNRINLKVNILDTLTMLSKYLRKTDTASLSSRIDAKGYGINFGSAQTTFAASTAYYFGLPGAGVATNAAQRRVYIPYAGTIKEIYLYVRTTNGTSGESWTMSLRLNNTSNTTIATTATTSTDKVFLNSNLNVSVVAGDYFEITTTAPATAPGVSNLYGTLIIR